MVFNQHRELSRGDPVGRGLDEIEDCLTTNLLLHVHLTFILQSLDSYPTLIQHSVNSHLVLDLAFTCCSHGIHLDNYLSLTE